MEVDTSFRNSFPSHLSSWQYYLPPASLILFLHFYNEKKNLSKLLISSCYKITSCCLLSSHCPQRNLMLTFTKWTLMVNVNYTSKLKMSLDSRKQLKRHNALLPFSQLVSPSLFSLLFIITRREICWH